jgi:hypothetical protein
MRKLTRRTTTVATAVAAATTLGVAFAAWTTNGTGTGEATSRASTDLVVSPAVTTQTLYPTGSSDVGVKIGNPNDYTVHVSSLTLAAGGITASGSGCNASSVSYTTQDNGGTGWDIAANDDITLDLANAVSMDNTALDACELNTFTVNLTANGASAA